MPKVTKPFGMRSLIVSNAEDEAELCPIELSFTPEVSTFTQVCDDGEKVRSIVKRWNVTFNAAEISLLA